LTDFSICFSFSLQQGQKSWVAELLTVYNLLRTAPAIIPDNGWYRPVGQGMGAALNMAAGMNAYILADRASWLNFGNKSDLELLFEGGAKLFNQYAFLPVNPEKHPHVKSQMTSRLEQWLTSKTAKDEINAYTISGQQLFHFNAKPAQHLN
jgi:tungstate transport system substrate-binding protein